MSDMLIRHMIWSCDAFVDINSLAHLLLVGNRVQYRVLLTFGTLMLGGLEFFVLSTASLHKMSPSEAEDTCCLVFTVSRG
jgi:hypothetical protein